MAKVGERITVSRVLDSRPRIFSLPTAIIVPAMFIVTSVGSIAYILQFPGYMILLSIVAFMITYFFLFGQESWRLLAKFRTPPKWTRSDVKAVPFTLTRRNNEATKQRKKRSYSRRETQ